MLRGGRARTLPVHEQPTHLRGFFASSYVGSQMDAQASMGAQLTIVFFPGCGQGPNESEGLGKFGENDR
jgi:hypothetical protein